ncbi:MAG: hypothetical protein HY925_16055 [Elusimicrobia bacterium]|nr:hypothetical protein [Elusimicrobiota bacterium]
MSFSPARRALLSIGVLAAAGGCALRRSVILESARPARILDVRGGETLCARTPCRITVERAWPYDSSLHYLRLKAVAEDGAVSELAVDTHQVRPEQVIRFSFPK